MLKKIAVVTGARRGIGLGITKELGREGYHVVMCATAPQAQDVVQQLHQQGISCEYFSIDVTDTMRRAELMTYVDETYGRVDVLVNNAGVAPKVRLDILHTTEESYDRVVDTNARSTFFMCQLFANLMIACQGKGLEDYHPRIVNISSMSAYTSSPERGEYCISKAAISMTTQLFAHRLAQYGIPVFEVRPGIIMTDMTSGVAQKYEKLIAEGVTPIKRFGQPQDVADCVAVCCSGRLDFATGQVLNADGGFHLRRL